MTTSPVNPDSEPLTRLLDAWRHGDAKARDQLVALVYEQIRRLAAGQLGRLHGPAVVTLRPTELANELFLRLLDADADWNDRNHFYAVACIAMRRILVDMTRARFSDKRGGHQVHLTLSAADQQAIGTTDIEALDQALQQLAVIDPRKSQIVEMSYLLGLRHQDIASALGLSVATVERDLRFSRAWLKQQLSDDV